MRSKDLESLVTLEHRIRTVLPEDYQASYETLAPVPMRAAGLKYDRDGNVAWDEIWQSFCDLAIAGGPPHKGTLLEPGTPAAVAEQPECYEAIAEEICRGVILASGLTAQSSPVLGWIRIGCFGETMAAWMLRAITTENVAVRGGPGMTLDLPAAPHFRLEKESKNVVTVIAKTTHYWMGHTPPGQRQAIASLFGALQEESPLVEPAYLADGVRDHAQQTIVAAMAEAIARETGLRESQHRYAGWLGLECPSVRAAVWMMRALVVGNVLSRREGTVLFVPVNPGIDPDGSIVVRSVTRIVHLAQKRGVR